MDGSIRLSAQERKVLLQEVRRVWWHLHEEITRNHRCRDIEELLDLVFDWLAAGPYFGIETSVYDVPHAA